MEAGGIKGTLSIHLIKQILIYIFLISRASFKRILCVDNELK